jgi:tetratricopeptide (TPR) repeat protein
VARPEVRPANRPSIERPTTRPNLPDKRPELNRPETRPNLPDKRPEINRPETRPNLPDKRPELNRPETRPNLPDKRPEINRPETRPNLPDKRPEINRPENRPNLPDKRPGLNRPESRPNLPENRPGMNRPENRPNLPDRKPDGKPGGPLANRPNTNRPSTLPGMVSYPNRPGKDRPNVGGRPVPGNGIRPNGGLAGVGGGNDRNRVNIGSGGNRTNVHIDKVNVGRRNVGLNRPDNLPARNRDWNTSKWGGNQGVWGNQVNINNNVRINNNFRRNVNYSYRPNYWGARPWWGANTCHTWHHGHWGYGWNSSYYHNRWYFDNDDDFASGFMWGIAVWSLGNMVYDMGYNTYRNPYPAPPVQYNDSKATIAYTQPVSVVAAANPPGDEEVVKIAETKSAEAVERSRAAFKQGDYVTAMSAVDEALGFTPGDVTLHEYRAVVLFSLGRYADAAGVLNSVLASGPGWGWDTMVGFYDSSSTYGEQLRKLEAYVKGRPDGAEGHFLLGYHYMVFGQMEKAYEQFEKTVELQPADSIARQLRDLTKSSLPDDGDAETTPLERPAPVPAEKLVGTWVCDRGADGKVTFVMTEAGDYTWAYMNGGNSNELKGTYGLDDKGLLVLTSDDSQMVSEVTLQDDKQMKFVLIGAPDGDPGLDFTRN